MLPKLTMLRVYDITIIFSSPHVGKHQTLYFTCPCLKFHLCCSFWPLYNSLSIAGSSNAFTKIFSVIIAQSPLHPFPLTLLQSISNRCLNLLSPLPLSFRTALFHIKHPITLLSNFSFHMMQNYSFCILLLLSPFLPIVSAIFPSMQISL